MHLLIHTSTLFFQAKAILDKETDSGACILSETCLSNLLLSPTSLINYGCGGGTSASHLTTGDNHQTTSTAGANNTHLKMEL